MDNRTFDDLTRVLSAVASRRAAVSAAAGAALGLIAPRLPGAEASAKRRKRKDKNKKPVLNEFGCVDVGGQCRGNDGLCCSGICQGKKPKKGEKDKSRCAAHDTGGCQAGQDVCAGEAVSCEGTGSCFRTTGKGSFCGGKGACAECTQDRDCQPIFGEGAACIVCADLCEATGRTACFPVA
jgi:hypothetical protein